MSKLLTGGDHASRSRYQSSLLVAFILLGTLLTVLGGLLFGNRALSPGELYSVLMTPDGRIDSIIVWKLRLPRSLSALIAGAGLGSSGYLLQTLTRNPIAGPGLTGVTAGAVTAIVFCLIYLPDISTAFHAPVGMVGGLAAAGMTFWISQGGRGKPLHLALGGISISLFLGALTTYLMLLSGPQAASLLHWVAGGFGGLSWQQIAYMTPWVVAGIAGALAFQRIIGLFTLSDQVAASMGVQLALWKPVVLLLSVLPVAGIASVAGPIAFVGIAAPHIARCLKPDGPGWTLALAATTGGWMVATADLAARTLAYPREIPVTFIVALIGGPVFIYLVQRRHFSFKG